MCSIGFHKLLYSPARERAFTKRNILAGWSKSGLFPFNPPRVLKDLPKPPTELMEADRLTAGPTLQNSMPVTPATPATPVTPVSVEALMSLQNLIVKRYAQILDRRGRQRLQRHLQKLAKAAQTFLATNALQRDQIQFLLRTNNESKVRRSTKTLVLGRGKVVSYDDLEEARAGRTKKETAKENGKKVKRGRKRKIDATKADSPQLAAKMTWNAEAPEPATASEDVGVTYATEDVLVPEPQRAPVARMW